MASNKETAVQTDFALGATRPDSIERSDTDLLNRGLRVAKNTTILSTGAIGVRDGSFYLATTGAENGIEIEPEVGQRYILVIVDDGIRVVSEIGLTVVEFTGAGWDADDDVWLNDMGDTILMGTGTIKPKALVYTSGSFTFGDFAFASGSGTSIRQPYYRFNTEAEIAVSDRTGTVTVTSTADLFSDDYIGTRIRYVNRELRITAVTDARTATAAVVQQLPPWYRLTMDSVNGFEVGDAVEHATLKGQGVITSISSGTYVWVLVTSLFTGFEGSGELVGPNAVRTITALVEQGDVPSTSLWDEQMMSPARGYPNSSSNHRGRLIFNDFPQAPNAIALSSAGSISDFLVGTNDDDAIIDTISASKSVRVLHVVSAEDLVILTSRGCYYVQTRDGSLMTPATFNPIEFDTMGASIVRPTRVDDGVVFIAKNGSNLYGAILQGDIYKAWTLIPLSDYHNHLIVTPTRVTSTNNDSDRPERFVFIRNSDGTVTVMRWERGPAYPQDTIGMVPWVTTGTYLSVFMAFGTIHSIVERTVNGATVRFIERFDPRSQLDAGARLTSLSALVVDENGDNVVDENGLELVGQDSAAVHLSGDTAAVFVNDWDLGDFTINDMGEPVDQYGSVISVPDVDVQIGLPFDMEIEPWARRTTNSPHGERESQRIIRLTAGVYNTIRFKFNDEDWGGLRAGEDVTLPPARRTEHVHFFPASRDHYQTLKFTTTRPGAFTLTALNFKVQL